MREGDTRVLSFSTNCTDLNLEIAVNSRLKQEQLNEIVDVILNDSTLVIIGNKDPNCIPDNYRFKVRVFSIHHTNFERELEEFEDKSHPRQNFTRRINNSRMVVVYTDFSGSN